MIGYISVFMCTTAEIDIAAVSKTRLLEEGLLTEERGGLAANISML